MRGSRDLWRRLVGVAIGQGGPLEPARLCTACVAVLGVAGAGISLMDDAGTTAAVYASDHWTERLQQLQFIGGDGPIADAYAHGEPIFETEIAAAGVSRWPGFGRAAADLGAGAVFSIPLQVGAARVGVLTLYRREAGPLDSEVGTDAVVAAEAITRLILGWQAATPEGLLAPELRDDGIYLAVVHQAAGMVSAQLELGVGAALALLRARSFANGQPIAELAADVVGGRVRFDA